MPLTWLPLQASNQQNQKQYIFSRNTSHDLDMANRVYHIACYYHISYY